MKLYRIKKKTWLFQRSPILGYINLDFLSCALGPNLAFVGVNYVKYSLAF